LRSKLLSVVVIALAAIAVATTTAGAEVDDPHYTDGTFCQGPFCPGGPPPIDPVFADGQACKIDVIDPPSFVYVTEHFVYGTTAPAGGVVPVVSDASAVFPYHGVAPGLFSVDIESYVAGRQGFRALTWNIGVGVTKWVPFDCRPKCPGSDVSPTGASLVVESKKVFVCKYVGTPGVDERLQTGQNPISVSVNSIKDFHGIGSFFNDAQGRSYVLAFDVSGQAPKK